MTRQIGNDELLRKLQEIDTAELPPSGRSAIAELLVDLRAAAPGQRAQLEVSVRETLETLVYGD